MGSRSSQTTSSNPVPYRSGNALHRPVQRFLIGLVLGGILAATLGWLAPVFAQGPPPGEAIPPAQVAPDEAEPGGLTVPSPETPPPPVIPIDIDGHWAADCIRELAQRRQLPMDEVARFYPQDPATWQFLTDLLNQSFPTEGAYGGAGAAETALQLPSAVNVLYSYPDRYYTPDRPVARTEAITALVAKLGLPYVARANDLLTTSLEDGSDVPPYGREGVAAALAAGVVVNYPDPQRLEGNRPITRGEVAALTCRAHPDPALRTIINADWIAQAQPLPAQPQPNPELRGVWLTNIDSDVLFSQENLAEAVQRLKAMNINTLYPVVWNSGYSLFPSPTMERILGKKQRIWPGNNPQFEETQGDRDLLQELIDLAHAEGMAVIPWFEFGFMAPAEYDLLDQHPEWFTQRQDGSREIPQGAETFTWMNPFHPRTQQMLLLMMAEVLENYDVEGIQVDDHLGMPVDMGYDPFTVALYADEHEGQTPPEDYTEPEWMRWRADKITAFMAQVRQLIDLRKPGAILSVSPNPYPFSYAKYLQDWPAWEAAGLLDELVIQIYRDDLDRFVWELNKPATVAASRNTPTSIGLLSGLRGRPTDVALLTEQLTAVRDRRYAGVSYFFYQSLWEPGRESLEERETQFQASFSQAANRP